MWWKISATGCVTEINFDIETFQYSFRQNCLSALPVALLQRLMTIPNAFSGLIIVRVQGVQDSGIRVNKLKIKASAFTDLGPLLRPRRASETGKD
jgi:hypothetical protein